MSDHDPLCRRAKIMESLMEVCPECALIAKVRADEREHMSAGQLGEIKRYGARGPLSDPPLLGEYVMVTYDDHLAAVAEVRDRILTAIEGIPAAAFDIGIIERDRILDVIDKA